MSRVPKQLALLALTLVSTGVAGCLAGSRQRQSNRVPEVPRTAGPPAFDPAKIQRAPAANLDAGSIDAFVSWVASTPVSDTQAIRNAVSAASADDEVARALVARLFDLPVMDVGHRQILLSIMGEMRRPEFVEPLVRFIGLPADRIVHAVPDHHGRGAFVTHTDTAALLQARAVEMLAYLSTTEALQAVLRFASHHEARPVRLAALDAYTFNHEDSPEAIEQARGAARRDEAKFVGLPRRTRDSDPAQVATKVAAFYEQYPEERPPVPQVLGGWIHNRSPRPRALY